MRKPILKVVRENPDRDRKDLIDAKYAIECLVDELILAVRTDGEAESLKQTLTEVIENLKETHFVRFCECCGSAFHQEEIERLSGLCLACDSVASRETWDDLRLQHIFDDGGR